MRAHGLVIVLVLVAMSLAQGAVSTGGSGGAGDDACAEAILRAYKEAPEVVSLIEGFTKHGYHDGGIRCVLVHGSCGVAGCAYQALVVHQFSYAGTNPQDRSILARVSGMAPLERPRVELVEIVPVQDRAHHLSKEKGSLPPKDENASSQRPR